MHRRARLTCHAGHGHAPEHISLHCRAAACVLISGDMVLPRISTNVSVIDLEPEGNPLPLYLASIARMRELPADTLVLPSHGKPFRGPYARIEQPSPTTTSASTPCSKLRARTADRPRAAAGAVPPPA